MVKGDALRMVLTILRNVNLQVNFIQWHWADVFRSNTLEKGAVVDE